MRVASSIPSVRERTKMAEKVHGLFVEKKKNTKSGVWQHFALKATENGSVTENEQDNFIFYLVYVHYKENKGHIVAYS